MLFFGFPLPGLGISLGWRHDRGGGRAPRGGFSTTFDAPNLWGGKNTLAVEGGEVR